MSALSGVKLYLTTLWSLALVKSIVSTRPHRPGPPNRSSIYDGTSYFVLSIIGPRWRSVLKDLGAHFTPCPGNDVDMYGMINTLYYKADKNLDGIITEPELNDVYQGFDLNGDSKVTHNEFTSLWKDIVGQTGEMASAYFFLADLNDDGFIMENDVRPTYLRFDRNNDGQVQAQEFNLKWQEIYRESPLAALYLRTDKNSDDDLQPSEYPRLFSSLDSTADGSVRKDNFVASWIKSHFGRDVDAKAIFAAFDTNNDDVGTIAEVAAFLKKYELSGNGNIEIVEVIEVSKLMPPL